MARASKFYALERAMLVRLGGGDTIIWPGRGKTWRWASNNEFAHSMLVHILYSKKLVVWSDGPAGRLYQLSEKGKRLLNGLD
jgi:hypothetical protein